MSAHINIAILESSPAIMQGLTLLFDTAPNINVIHQSSSIVDNFEPLDNYKLDIVLMDIDTDKKEEVDALNHLIQKNPDLKIIIYTPCHNKSKVFQFLKKGIPGFLFKDVDPQHLIEAVNSVHQGGISLSNCIKTALIENVSNRLNQPKIRLTKREQQVLGLISRGMSNEDIAEKLFVSTRTVKFHTSSIFKKLEVKNRTEAASRWSEMNIDKANLASSVSNPAFADVDICHGVSHCNPVQSNDDKSSAFLVNTVQKDSNKAH